ncbi:origin recognition complex, subunit 6 [Boeremia exigua]|uniref:origin recognition complex, subunit 6 n=1 Tax=Boeremia exigua TaxID=749465 RepID=UPI001E8CBCA8|nr:origin recognition complex, subunit 6 [Boeremia exigua]KAH6614810.1 origin recognition complex, subunit 6 [Boeremia exigua]
MSRASIEQALTGLVPTLNGPLPLELVDIALSLLARSRSVANSLKPDEEIARPYACAQLACERLKSRLNLPSVASRPPCPPRVYKKLYSYLASALPDSSTPREPQTPRKNLPSASDSAKNTPKTPLSARKTPRTIQKTDSGAGEPPAWVMPCIRVLVKKFSFPLAAPHVYTGIESVLPLMARMTTAAAGTPSKRPRRAASASQAPIAAVTETKLFALVVVVVLYVLARMTTQNVTPEQYNERRNTAISTILELPEAKDVAYNSLSPEIDMLMTVAQQEGWLQMEWLLNVSPPGDADDMEGIETVNANTSRSSTGTVLGLKNSGSDSIGFGTMLQDCNDYLGERQMQEFKTWEADVMARYNAKEAAGE